MSYESEQLSPVDLLFTADALTGLLHSALRERDWLDAYLLTAGLNQLVEDHLHPDPFQLHRASAFLHRDGATATRVTESLLRAAGRVLRPVAVGPGARALWRLRDVLTDTSTRLGRSVIEPDYGAPTLPDELDAALSAAQRLGPDVLRVPACFRSFDQHPDDVVELVRRYLTGADLSAPVCVVGVRTSGSYLAPLCAAALTAAGATAVSVLTIRPGAPWCRREAQVARNTAAEGGTILVIDDPPVTGTALAQAARAIERCGVPTHSIIFLVALGCSEVPTALDRWSGVYLPWSQWTLHTRTTPGAVAATLTRLLGPGHRVTARWLSSSGAVRRTGTRSLYKVDIATDDGVTCREIAVEGAGLGFLGRHALAVARAVPGHIPRVYGLDEGLLYLDSAPAATSPPDESDLAEAVTRYVADRSHTLRVDTDPTRHLRGRQPVWEVAGGLLSTEFGRLAPVGQCVLIDPITQRLTRTTSRSVPDGQTHVRHWSSPSPTCPLRKSSFHQRSFSNLELVCYDATFDLAGAVADPPSDDFAALVRDTYLEHTGQVIDHERWLLYRLTHLWRLGRTGEIDRQRVQDRSADAVHDYLSAVVPRCGEVEDGVGGPLCAIDLDGVLETDPLGYPCTTPTGVIALRALTAHGFRPVLVTGRSLPDTIARCRRFDLTGAVAEYGAVLYDPRTGHCTDLRDDTAIACIRKVRRLLRKHHDVEVDERHQYIVRARVRGGPLPAELTREIESIMNGSVRIVVGEGQTDVVPSGIDKGSGLRALVDRFGGEVALAVGDSTEDLTMFAEAEIARAPRNANSVVRAARIPVTRRAYQAGLADACADLLGHRPGSCPQCRPPEMSTRTASLCAVLGLREDGLRGLAFRTARLATLAARTKL